MSHLSVLYPVSVGAVILNTQNQILLFSKPHRHDWRCVSGWVEKETLWDAIHREIHEETGLTGFRVGHVLDAHTYLYQKDKPLISVWFLVSYLYGEIHPSDDLANYHFAWFKEPEVENLSIEIPDRREIIYKAFQFKNRLD